MSGDRKQARRASSSWTRSSVVADFWEGGGGLEGVGLGVGSLGPAEGEAAGVVWLEEPDSSRVAESV